MQTARNFLAGLSQSVWFAVVTLASVPFYLTYLGMEAYGLIGFLVFTQGVVQLLDLGLAPTISREVARCTAQNDPRGASQLLHTLAVIYWATASLILGCTLLAGPAIAEYWLKTNTLPVGVVASATSLIGVVIACRWPIGLYQGALIGAQRLTIASRINILMVTATNLGGVLILAFVSPTIEALFAWQAAVALAFCLVMMRAAWLVIGKSAPRKFNWRRLREVWRFSAGMSLVAATGIVLLQIDKGILSSMLTLEQFGQYMLATVIASSLYVLLQPLFNTIYPKMTELVSTGDSKRLAELYGVGTHVLSATLFPIASAVALFSADLVYVWTGDRIAAERVAPLVSLLIWGTALNGIMHFPYALQISSGTTRLPLTINLVLIAVSVPSTVVLTSTYGAVGGAASWAFLNVWYLLLGTWLTHRLLLRGMGARWLIWEVLVPLGASLLIVGSGAWLVRLGVHSSMTNLVAAAAIALVAFVVNMSFNGNYFIRLRRAFS